eukprot:gene5127-34933_t
MRPANFLLLASLCVNALLFASASDESCAGPLVQLSVGLSSTTQDGSGSESVFYGVLASFGSFLNETEERAPSQVALFKPVDACSPLEGTIPDGSAVLVERGGCTFLDKASHVQAAGGVAMLMYNNVSGCANMGYDVNDTRAQTVTLAAVSISRHEAQQILQLLEEAGPGQLEVELDRVNERTLDPGFVLLWLMAVGTVVAGSLWAGHDHSQRKKGGRSRGGGDSVSQAGGINPEESVDITINFAIAFVCIASLVLVLMFFFLSKAVFYILLVFFCIAAAQATTVVLAFFLRLVVSPSLANQTSHVPLIGYCPTLDMISAPISIAICVVWVIWRNSDWSWLLQDFLGVSLMLLVLRTLKLNSVKVASVLLSLLFVYDVFWVFLEPLIFGGESVMVVVAKGGSSQEFLPMLLRVPRLVYRELGGYSMLGYGDVILPGILVAYTRRLDIDLHLPSCSFGNYFIPTCLGYCAGLMLTYCALLFSWFGDQGQPALLYLVPCTLGTVFLIAYLRKEVQVLWHSSNKQYNLIDDDGHDRSE